MTETENQNVQKPEEMNNQNNNIKNEIRQRNAVLINQQTKRQIRDWLEGNPYQELLEYMKSRVMGQENIAIVVANVYNYLKNVSIPDTGMEMPTHGNCNNMILAAPSGSGKTETYRAFKDYFKKRIPALRLTISDVSNLTATGYRGAEPSSSRTDGRREVAEEFVALRLRLLQLLRDVLSRPYSCRRCRWPSMSQKTHPT